MLPDQVGPPVTCDIRRRSFRNPNTQVKITDIGLVGISLRTLGHVNFPVTVQLMNADQAGKTGMTAWRTSLLPSQMCCRYPIVRSRQKMARRLCMFGHPSEDEYV